jgi:hypothetical protein
MKIESKSKITKLGRTFIHPNILTILGTYKCTAACENCCFDSNPSLTNRLSYENIVSFIKESLKLQTIELIVFSGGECFLLGDDLVRAVEYIASQGIKTRCVTNGYWASSKEAGYRRLQQLRSAGLNEINISTGDFHQEWVSEQCVVNAACSGVEVGLDHTLIMVELQKQRRVTMASLLNNNLQLRELWNSTSRDQFNILESPWMPMSAEEIIEQNDQSRLNRYNLHSKKGCDSILSTIVATPDHKVGFCCGLSREKIPELNMHWEKGFLLEHLEEAGRDFMKIWLFVEGPEKILAWAASKNPKIDWENRYAHHCHTCLALFDDPLVRATIAENYKERVDDVLMRYSLILRKQELLES